MPRITFNKADAKTLFRFAARVADDHAVDAAWESRVEKLSQLCAAGVSKTHIAFLGTAILAKALDTKVSLYAIKPEHADNQENSFSARTLCHSVIVPLAAELGIHIGVTGREPLNNQPYFRMKRLNDGTPVHAGGQAAFNYMLELVRELEALTTTAPAREALRAFIAVRRRHQPRYVTMSGEIVVGPERLWELIGKLVRQNSENGRRAQAAVAGLLDVFAEGRVEAGRINDPSRKSPGDVCVRSSVQSDSWEKAIEVRDKPVTEEDVQIFAKKCIDMGVREAAIVMVAEDQRPLDTMSLLDWAISFGVGLTLFSNWRELTGQVLFWAALPKPEAAVQAARHIERRLIAIEASPQAVVYWRELCTAKSSLRE